MSDALFADLCMCGHPVDWHGHSGKGDCEHDGECPCVEFSASHLWVRSAVTGVVMCRRCGTYRDYGGTEVRCWGGPA